MTVIKEEVFVEHIKGGAFSSICLNTGVMFKNANKWHLISTNSQNFWRYHEQGHYELQTKDENAANWYAFQKLHQAGGDIEEALRSFNIVLNKFIPKHRQQIKDAAVMVATLKNKTMRTTDVLSSFQELFTDNAPDYSPGNPGNGSYDAVDPISPVKPSPVNALIMGEVKPEILVLDSNPGIKPMKQDNINTGTILIKNPNDLTGVKQTLGAATGAGNSQSNAPKNDAPVKGIDMKHLAEKAKEHWIVILLVVLLIIALISRK